MKVAIYCRLSEEDRNKQLSTDDSESIQNQKSMLLQYVIDKGWDVYGIYSDDDYAGADRNRPEWKRLIEDAEYKKFDVVLCKTQSRFTRELEIVEKYIHGLFPKWGIRFIGLVDNADTAVVGNKKARQINGLVNEWYLEDMSENIKKTLTNRREQGYHIGAFALYGYKKDPNNKGKLIIDKESAEIVREVFNLYASGYGKTAIARLLNHRGIPNPTEYKRLQGLRYKLPKHKLKTVWRYYTISSMLTNEMYAGNMIQGKYGSVSYKTRVNKPRPKKEWIRVENTHEPIINREMWDRVQELVRERAKPFGTGKVGLFSKKARCINCGYTMRTNKQNGGRYYLMCGTRHTARDSCIGAFISVPALERAILYELQLLIDNHLDPSEVVKHTRLADNLDQRLEKLEADKSVYNKKLAEYNNAIKEVYVDKVKGIITESEFVAFSRDFAEDKERLEAHVADIDEELEALHRRLEQASNQSEIIDQYAHVEHLDRVMVERLIDHVRVGKRDPETKQVPVEIHWNF